MSVIESSVRPWKAPSKAITAGRPVASRANLTAFSTASVPALKKAALAGTVNGARASRRSASSTYGSYGTTVKSVWMKRPICSVAASTTRGCACPTLTQPTPPVKSMKTFPSTSVIVAPRASCATIGSTIDFAFAITRDLRSRIAAERGPGIAVRISIVFVVAMAAGG